MKLSLCIPMYNEADVIAETARTLTAYLDTAFGDDYEVIFSDDGSTDDSVSRVKALALPHVRVISYPDNRGKGSAVREGMLAARGDYIMFTDADLAYGVAVIATMVEALDTAPEAAIAIGSRNLAENGYAQYTFLRKVASKLYLKVLTLVGGLRLSDSQCGCKIFRAEAARELFSRCRVDGFAFDFEVILRAQKAGMVLREVPVTILRHHASKVHVFRDTFGMLGDLIRIKRALRKESPHS